MCRQPYCKGGSNLDCWRMGTGFVMTLHAAMSTIPAELRLSHVAFNQLSSSPQERKFMCFLLEWHSGQFGWQTDQFMLLIHSDDISDYLFCDSQSAAICRVYRNQLMGFCNKRVQFWLEGQRENFSYTSFQNHGKDTNITTTCMLLYVQF